MKDDYTREACKRYCQENGAAIMFIQDHPYPQTIEGVQSMIGSSRLPWYYSEAIQEFVRMSSAFVTVANVTVADVTIETLQLHHTCYVFVQA
jgi:hypothetical protein